MKNNEGFTLIELIVVIAIIAVLAVVLAPQYIQYVERGRESNDVQIAQNLMDAASVAAADPTLSSPAYSYIVTMDVNGGVTVTSRAAAGATPGIVGGTDAFYRAFFAVVGTNNMTVQSVEGKKESLVIEVNTQTGDVVAKGATADALGWDKLLN